MFTDAAIWVIWATCALNLPTELPQATAWYEETQNEFPQYWISGPEERWQLILEFLENREPASEEAQALMPGEALDYAYALSLHPIVDDEQAYALAEASIQAIANRCDGAVVMDPLDDLAARPAK
jgi:hypothetical protein